MARILTNIQWHLSLEGHSLRSFRDYQPPGMDPEGWRAEFERRPLAEILPLIPAAEKPDILVCTSPEYLPIPWDIHTFRGPKVLLITDWNVCLRFLPDLCKLFDFCFTDWPGYRLLRKAGIANVHHQALFGHDPERFRILSPAPRRDLDVSFCGNLNGGLHGERNRLLARVARWAEGAGRPVHLRQAFDRGYVEVLSRSRLVFNHSIRGEANMRLFEAMACGAVPLVEETNLEASILFQEGRHFFRYKAKDLERNLDGLLADPGRIEAVAQEARKEVARHTKARQIETLLDTVLRGAPAHRGHASPEPRTRANLVKIRVLGMGYTAQEAIREIQARGAGIPGLEQETLPGLLLALIEREAGEARAAARSALEHLLALPALPAAIRLFLAMEAAFRDKDWNGLLAKSQACRGALSSDRSSTLEAAVFAFLLPPIDLGQGMNSDLNRAFQADLQAGGGHAGLDLLAARCRFLQAEACLALGLPPDPQDLASLYAFPAASLPRHRLEADLAVQAADAARLRAACQAWFAEAPVDTSAWDRILAGLGRLGDRSGRERFLREFLVLARFLLAPELADRLAETLRAESAP